MSAAAGGVYLLAPCNVRHAHHHRRPQQQLHLAIRFPERTQRKLRTAAVFWDLVTRVAGRNQGVSEIEHKPRGKKNSRTSTGTGGQSMSLGNICGWKKLTGQGNNRKWYNKKKKEWFLTGQQVCPRSLVCATADGPL